MPFRMGPWEIAMILGIILIVFGVGKLPDALGAIGKGLRNFKKAESGEDDDEATQNGRSNGKDEGKTARRD